MQASQDIDFLPHDGPLREDVHRLGALVGRMLAEQSGTLFFSRVEQVRQAAIHRRRGHGPVAALSAALAGLATDQAEALARAFATYFQVVNIAERVHRIRRRRDYQREAATPQPESWLAVLAQLKAEGVSAEELWDGLERLVVEPVFTAHPTESMRRSLLEKEQVIVKALIDNFDPKRTPQERHRDDARIFMALCAAWQTAEMASIQPSVQDEHDHVSFYLAHPIYQIIPAVYASLGEALEQVYRLSVPPSALLGFATWVGGDMDGNPHVNAGTIAASLAAQRVQIVERYIEDIHALSRLLSQTEDRVAVSTALHARLDAYRARFPQAAAKIRPRHRNMPYRCLLLLIKERLHASVEDAADGYASVAELLSDLQLIASSLNEHHGLHAGAYAVTRLMWRVHSFGFHLARLDIRQDAQVHEEALAALWQDPQWAQLEPDQRAIRLRPFAAGAARFAVSHHATVHALYDVLVTLGDARRRYGEAAIGLYIISMARMAADVLAVLALARYSGLIAAADQQVPLDIAPLFETVDDLQHAPETLRALLADPVYRQHLRARGDRQWIMLGYSDSGKDGGIVAARWGLQHAQIELLQVARQAGITLSFFHGRGGSTSRGGSRMTPALLSAPHGSVAGVLRVTEQGEVIHRQYGIRALALRHLEQMLGAALRASVRPRPVSSRETLWGERMAALAAYSQQAYRAFIEHADFVEYFRHATPIDVIERMALGSRPSRRRQMRGVQDLRAIPWVFAWSQCRAMLTGWYGLGSALERAAVEFGPSVLMEMAHDWPFFANLLDDVEMVLAKCDLSIAEAFSRLAGPLHESFFPHLQQEFGLTRDWLLRLKGIDHLLQNEPRLALSIRLRNPYIDPMSLLQVDLLRRWRASGQGDEALLRALIACVNGVAQGLQNTG